MSRNCCLLIGYLAISVFAHASHASDDKLSEALASDEKTACRDDDLSGPTCNLQLLQLKEQTQKIQKRANPSGGCEHHYSRYNYARKASWPTEYTDTFTYKDCVLGAINSPIDIKTFTAVAGFYEPLDVVFESHDSHVINNGHGLKVHPDGQHNTFGTMIVDGHKYPIVQFHVHLNAEHEVNGMLPAMEMHMFGNDGTAYGNAVVAILFDIDWNPWSAGNALFASMIEDIPRVGCDSPIGKVNLGAAFKRELDGPFWTYNGSTTTPPCKQDVRWNVMERRGKISSKQYYKFKSQAYMNPQNNRPIQPTNGRIVYYNNRRGA